MTTAVLADASVISLLGAGLTVAFLHAALPTHWLPFVLVGRAQGWRTRRAVGVAVLAALAHIASTALVGALIVLAGLALDRWIAGVLPYAAAALLFVFGVYYLATAGRRMRKADAAVATPAPRRASDRAAALGLIALLAISPGEVLLPFYLNAAPMGVTALTLLTLAFTLGTVAGMAILTGLAYAGAALFKVERLARYEGAILGVALIGLSLLLILRPH